MLSTGEPGNNESHWTWPLIRFRYTSNPILLHENYYTVGVHAPCIWDPITALLPISTPLHYSSFLLFVTKNCKKELLSFALSVYPVSKQFYCPVRFEVLTTVKMSMLVFWFVTPCGLNISEERTTSTSRASEERTVSIFRIEALDMETGLKPWIWRQYVPAKCWCLTTSPHGVTNQKIHDDL
jgi:hypothetical protein